MVEPLRHHKYSRKTIFRPKIVPGLHSLVVPSVMWHVLNGTSGHMGSDGATFDQKYHVVLRIWAKKIEKFLGSCQFGSNSSVCFDYAAAVYNFLHTTAYWGLVLLVPCLGVRGNCIASDLRWETNWVSDLTFYAIDKKRDCSRILRSFSFRLSYFFWVCLTHMRSLSSKFYT